MKVINKKYCTSGSYFVLTTNKSLIIKRWKGKREKYLFALRTYMDGRVYTLKMENVNSWFVHKIKVKVIYGLLELSFNSFRYLN